MLLNEMEIFYYVVEQQSFSGAAKRLEVSKSFISKRMTKLEHALKVRLISRTTRKLTLTEAGENFYYYASHVVQEGEKAYSMISELRGKPAGILKISIPPALALNLISPMISEFLKQYPEVILDIRLENRLVDLIKEGYDLALRAAKLESSNLIAQKILTVSYGVFATEEYLKHHQPILTPSDLISHHCAVYSGSNVVGEIKFIKDNSEEIIYVKGNLMSNHLDLIKQAILSDVAIGILPEFMVKKELQNGKIRRCLDNYDLPSGDLYAIYPEKEFKLPKFNCFLENLKKYLAL